MSNKISGGFQRMVHFLVRAFMGLMLFTILIALILVIIIGMGGMP